MRVRVILSCVLLAGAAFAAGKTGTITVMANALGAVVEVDNLEVGMAPLMETEMLAGEHQIRIYRPGYMEFTQTIQVKAGTNLEVVADLLPVAGVLTVKGDEKGAKVLLDGTEIGAVPLFNHEMPPGRHLVTVRFSRGKVFEKALIVTPGTDYPVQADLALAKDPAAVVAAAPVPGPAPKAPPPAAAAAVVPAPAAAVDPMGLEPTGVSGDEWYTQWWLWAGLGAVVVAGVAIPLATSGTEFVRLPPDAARDCPGGGCIVLGGAR